MNINMRFAMIDFPLPVFAWSPESSDYREVRTTTSTLFQSFCTSPSARSLTAGSLGHGTKAGSALDKLAHMVPPRYQLVYPDELQIYLP